VLIVSPIAPSGFRVPSVLRTLFGPRNSNTENAQRAGTTASSGGSVGPSGSPDAEAVLQRLEWTVIKRLDGLLHGDYRSLFRGFGLDLADLREYQASDDVRFIDWNVTARMNTPYVREFQEDREISAWFLCDLSGSVDFGSQLRSKRTVASQLVAILARLLTRHGNQVGAVLYNQMQNQPDVIPPRHGRRQVLQLIDRMRALSSGRDDKSLKMPQLTNLAHMMDASRQVLKRRSVVVVISDFISSPGWERPLALLAQRHEVIAIRLLDPLEIRLPDLGQVVFTDPETGEQLLVDSSDRAFRSRFEALATQRETTLAQGMLDAGVEAISISTQDDLAQAIFSLTDLRKRRKKRA
jgi:uncharacterized protein (DUF58 family)